MSLIKKYSLYDVINSIVFATSFEDNKYIPGEKEFSELDENIFYIYKEVGSKMLFQSFFYINTDDLYNEENCEEKKISISTIEEENVIENHIEAKEIMEIEDNTNIEKNKVINLIENKNYNINENVINLNEEENENNNNKKNQNENKEVIINYINNNYLNKNNTIDLSESDDNSSDEVLPFVNLNEIPEKDSNNINQIIDLNKMNTLSEQKEESPQRISEERKSINLNQNKEIQILKKNIKKYKIEDISYHCSIIDGKYYKYKFDKRINKHLIRFICYNPNCESWGIYDANDKTFTLQKIHLVGDSIICYHNFMNAQDKKNYSYMITNHVEEIQMYKDT